MRFKIILIIALALASASQGKEKTVGTRCEALDAGSWAASQWISAVDAPVVSGKVNSKDNKHDSDAGLDVAPGIASLELRKDRLDQ